MGYKEWLLESAAHYEEEEEDDHEKTRHEDDSGDKICDVEKSEATTAEEQKEAPAVPESKAQKLVDKIKSSEGADLKRLLFSLKTSFQVCLQSSRYSTH